MAEPRSFPHRVFVSDLRRDGHYLRTTWHPEHGAFVVSHWRGDVCVAATRIRVEDAADLVALFANGLADAASTRSAAAADGTRARPALSRWRALLVRWREAVRQRRPLAPVVRLQAREPHEPASGFAGEPRWRQSDR
ncbi:MAG TPA: hypothetical protein VGQ20_10145 [Acidimicrobiales bacterium]|jgi:hypothetical protein|nr:hypothetical protein [Acidimicrobiales bacterium]